MNFLPHAPPSTLAWFGSLALSTATHAGIGAFVLFSGAVVSMREGEPVEAREASFDVSLEILDLRSIDESIPIEDLSNIPEDTVVVDPDSFEVEASDAEFAALTPEETLLEPDSGSIDSDEIEPYTLEPLALEPDLIESEFVEPDFAEPEAIVPKPVEPQVAEIEPDTLKPSALKPDLVVSEVVEPDLTEPEAIVPKPVESQGAEILPEFEAMQVPVDASLIAVEEDVAQLQSIQPEPQSAPQPVPLIQQSIAIDDLSPIDNTVLSPLSEAGSVPLDPAILDSNFIDLALLLPEPDSVPPVELPQVEAVLEALPENQPETAPEVLPEIVPDVAPEDVAKLSPYSVTPDPSDTAQPDVVTGLPKRQPLVNPTASDIAIGQLLRRIRLLPQAQCTLALPRRTSGGVGAGVSLIGADSELLENYSGQITDELGFMPVITSEVIDPRQCALLDALRQSNSYPANRIGLSLESTDLVNGDALNGKVIGAAGLFLSLLLIDDNGVVQDLAPFVTLEGATPAFEAPVARAGRARVTRQILVALGTTDGPINLSEQIGREAQQVFSEIPAATLKGMLFGIATFDLR